MSLRVPGAATSKLVPKTSVIEDARRGEVYVQIYREEGVTDAPQLVPLAEAAEAARGMAVYIDQLRLMDALADPTIDAEDLVIETDIVQGGEIAKLFLNVFDLNAHDKSFLVHALFGGLVLNPGFNAQGDQGQKRENGSHCESG